MVTRTVQFVKAFGVASRLQAPTHLAGLVLVSAVGCAASSAARAPTASTSSAHRLGTVLARPEMSASNAPAPAGECARLLPALDQVTAVAAAVASLRVTTPESQMEEVMRRVHDTLSAIDPLPDAFTIPTLAAEANRVRLATAYLSHETAALFGLKHLGERDLLPVEHSLYIAGRQVDLAILSARRRCEPSEPLRAQSAAWVAASTTVLAAITSPLRACLSGETPAHQEELRVELHIAADGQIMIAGPVDFSSFSGYRSEAVYCVVRVLERAHFPPPAGLVIMIQPFLRNSEYLF